MNRKILSLAVVIIFGGVVLHFTRFESASLQERDRALSPVISQSISAITQVPQARSQEVKPTSPSSEDKVDPQVEEYQQAAYALAEKIEKLGLDGEELNELFNRVGKENFLKHVPAEIRPDYLLLEEKIAALRKNYLRQDGMSERFFTRYQVQMPEWMAKHREELNEVRLPSAVDSIIKKKMNDPEINNEEINEILAGCGKGNSSCINKAFALLIDSHHGLEDSQLKLIQEYL